MKFKRNNKSKKVGKFVYWTPRIVSILFILFLMLFSLDVFGQGYGFWGTLLAFLMHNIPVFILTVLLIISWKHEIVGAAAFMIVGLLYILMLVIDALKNKFEWYMLAWAIQISGIAFFIGILFLMNWRRKNKL